MKLDGWRSMVHQQAICFCISVVLLLCMAGSLLAQSDHPDTEASIKRGMAVYNDNCMACHGLDGRGERGLNPPLINSGTVQGDKSRLIRIILEGMNETIKIDGDCINRLCLR